MRIGLCWNDLVARSAEAGIQQHNNNVKVRLTFALGDKIRRAVLIAERMTSNADWLRPSRNQALNIFDDDRLAEYGAHARKFR